MNPYLKPEQFEAAGAKVMSVDELLKVSDFVSVHVPLTPEIKYLFNTDTLALMRNVLNMSRGGIVNKAGHISEYAADVQENE